MCLNEDVMYTKTYQNGSPVIMAYRVKKKKKEQSPQSTSTTQTASTLNPFEERLAKLEELVSKLTKPMEEQPKKSGGKFDGII